MIFIGGTGRSGTGITRDLFEKHPQVATLPFESRFIIDPDGIIDFYRSSAAIWSPFLADKRLKRLENLLNTLAEVPIWPMGRYRGWELDKHLPNFKRYVQDLITELHDFSFLGRWVGTETYLRKQPTFYFAGSKSKEDLALILGQFIDNVIKYFLVKQGKSIYVETNTWNILFARELLELVPTAKIVHVVRDPRDVVASMVTQTWCPSDIYQAVLFYQSIINHWFEMKRDLPDGSYYEFKLEDLCESTEWVVKDLCDFIGIRYDSIMLDIDLSQGHIGRWKKDFTASEQRMICNGLSTEITKLDYKEYVRSYFQIETPP